MREIILDERDFQAIGQVHAYLADELAFPDYYGGNLSALADCLGDIDAPTRIVVRERADEARAADEQGLAFARLCRVMRRESRENPFLDVIVYEDDLEQDGQDKPAGIDADTALERLREGNAAFVQSHVNTADISPALVERLFHEGQRPFACVITCSDSRVAPEHVFMCGLGELFVCRVAGNVVGGHELASAVYAASHLHTSLVVVMGHTHCGAIEATRHDGDHGSVAPLTRSIRQAIGEETDPYAAAVLNVRAGVACLSSCPELEELERTGALRIIGAVYHTHSGVVDFLD